MPSGNTRVARGAARAVGRLSSALADIPLALKCPLLALGTLQPRWGLFAETTSRLALAAVRNGNTNRRAATSLYPAGRSLLGFAPNNRSCGEGREMVTRCRALFVGVAVIGYLAASQAAHAQDKTIKIGALFPKSGPGSYCGAQDKQGVELALEQLNKTGVNGYKFAVQYEDSSCAPLPATQAAKRLIEQFKPDVIIGEECSDATLAVMPVIEQAKVP